MKPYIPYDVIPSDYVLPMATSADGTPLLSRKLTVPDWVVDSDIVMQSVHITEEARESLEAAVREGVCKHYRDIDSLIEFITQVCYLFMYDFYVLMILSGAETRHTRSSSRPR